MHRQNYEVSPSLLKSSTLLFSKEANMIVDDSQQHLSASEQLSNNDGTRLCSE